VPFGQNELSQKKPHKTNQKIKFLRLIPRKVSFTNTAYSKNRHEANYEDRQLVWLGLAKYDMKFKPELANQKHISRLAQVRN